MVAAAGCKCVYLGHVFIWTAGARSDNSVKIPSAKIPLFATPPVLEAKKGVFEGKLEGCSHAEIILQ